MSNFLYQGSIYDSIVFLLQKQCVKLQGMKAKLLMDEEELRRKELERENLLVARHVPQEPTTPTAPDVQVEDCQ